MILLLSHRAPCSPMKWATSWREWRQFSAQQHRWRSDCTYVHVCTGLESNLEAIHIKRSPLLCPPYCTSQIHQNDPEKLVDLHYSLALSYRNSPELRQTWLDSIAALHLKYGNYSEAAQCCIHIAGMVAEYLKMKGTCGAPCKLRIYLWSVRSVLKYLQFNIFEQPYPGCWVRGENW